ncbi:RNA 2'-phosphotransferase [Longispora albida]|uniref:RNA 2'-phosphotransferase n=1 Tax=Longispora albida TaxID=203523 RepID=UPI00047558B6|nr:RNA 2'-phosphotransferase [Longispora albida]
MDVVKISKRMSRALRHSPERLGLRLDEGGWAEISDLLAALGISREELDMVVAENDKQRFAIEGTRIRASQGHSIDVDLGYEPKDPPVVLYHGTPIGNIASIRATGLSKGGRHHVHLSGDTDTARRVGARRGRPVIITVHSGRMAADGHAFYQSANGVWLTEHVPPAYLSFD